MTLDFAMPLTLFLVTLLSMFLNRKTEDKLKGAFEERELRVQDAALLVGMMAVMITVIVFVQQISAVLMVLFLFSYSMLLFIFGYMFSKNRWYIGIIGPAIFILLYVFLRDTLIWRLYLADIYGLVFAVLITLYLATLYTWKTTAVFGALITVMDIILVLVTRTMVEAASAATSLSLPVLVSVPLLPLVITEKGMLWMSLGLGDFFFSGLLAIQTLKKYGKRYAILSAIAMAISFSIFEAFILNSNVRAFPGTLMIICGWIPLVLYKTLRNNRAFQNAWALVTSKIKH
jgi:hypothetical protein